MTGWSYTSADGHPGFCALHPIQSGVDAGATAIRPMTPTEGAIYQALQGYMQVHPRMQGEIDRLAVELAAAEAERDAAVRQARADALEEAARIAETRGRGDHEWVRDSLWDAIRKRTAADIRRALAEPRP